jgi:pimeloyl-ACP methyl ester carboxylesterase
VTVAWNFAPEFSDARAAMLQAERARYRDLDLSAVARLCDAFLAVDFTAGLRAVTAPTCIIASQHDRLKGPSHAGIIRRAIPGSQWRVLPGAGHSVCMESPAAFTRAVLGFLRRLAPAG